MTNQLEILRDYIRREAGYEGEVAPEVDLLKKHILDSFSIVQLAMFIQERFEIILDAEDLVRENLCSLCNVMALIERKKNGSAATAAYKS